MGSDHAFLPCCRRCPVGSCLADLKAPYRDVIAARLSREEAHSSDVDLCHLGVGIKPAEVCVDDCLIALLLGIPLIL